jgi:hypothetical protein
MSVLYSKIFTKEITNDTLRITGSMGVKLISILNTTATSGTVTGAQSLGGITSSALNIGESESVTISAWEASVIEDLTINAPAGCTLKIIASV